MLTLSKRGAFFVSFLVGILVLFVGLASWGVPPESHTSYWLVFSGFLGLGVWLLVSIFSNEAYQELRERHRTAMSFGHLSVTHGSIEQALSHLASRLLEKFNAQNELYALNFRTKLEEQALEELSDEIPEDKERFGEFVEVAKKWGIEVPDRWQYKDWILPPSTPETKLDGEPMHAEADQRP